jgi:branched-chain amino acid transport system substrate-binding protein
VLCPVRRVDEEANKADHCRESGFAAAAQSTGTLTEEVMTKNASISSEQASAGGYGLPRRTLLKASVAAGLAPLAMPFIGNAEAAAPLKVGILLPKAGPYAVQGEFGHNGAEIAVADAGGHINGRLVELVWLDESTPQGTSQNMRKLIEENKVVAVQGGVNSGDVLAAMPVAERAKTLFMATGPNATEITGKNCNRYTFRIDLPNAVIVKAAYSQLGNFGKDWYFLSASYAWGIDAYEQMKAVLLQHGGKVVGADQAPLGTTDFSSFILKIRQANPSVVFLALGGSDLTNFLKQFHEVGMSGKIPISAPIVNDSDLWAAGPDVATGIYPKLWNYTGPQVTASGQKFVKDFVAKVGKPPEVEGWQDWFGCTAILTALRETKATEGAKLVQFLEHHKFEGYKSMPIWFRSWDHQLIQPVLITEVRKKITDKYDYFEVLGEEPKDANGLDAYFGTEAGIGCKLPTA